LHRLQVSLKSILDWKADQLRQTGRLKKQVKELLAEKEKAEQDFINSIMASTSKESTEQFEKMDKVIGTP
jgi:hypothetical protein